MTNASSNTLPAKHREYVKLYKVFEDPNTLSGPDDEEVVEDYGQFLLDTRSQSSLQEAYTANCDDFSQYFGMAFPARDEQGNNITFVSPKTAAGLKLNGWEFPTDVTVTSID